jgi:hypothetical protein
MPNNPQEWFASLPPITKWWLCAAVASGMLGRLGLLSPWSLAMDWPSIMKLQLWRLFTPFLFFGFPSFPWLIQMFMLCVVLRPSRHHCAVRHAPTVLGLCGEHGSSTQAEPPTAAACHRALPTGGFRDAAIPPRSSTSAKPPRSAPVFPLPALAPLSHARACRSRFVPAYENDPFPSGPGLHMGNVADTVTMLGFGAAVLLAAGTLLRMPFLAGALFMMVLYVWSKRHPEAPTSFYMFNVPAAYLPWVMTGFSFIVGQDPIPDLLGIGVGHLYFFAKQVLPGMEGPWKDRVLLRTPDLLYRFFNERATHANAAAVRMAERRAGGGGGGGHNWGAGQALGRGG